MKKEKKHASKPDGGSRPIPRNKPLHIPLDFDKAIDALLKIKPKKDKPRS